MNEHEDALRQLETMDPLEFLKQYLGDSVSRPLMQLVYELKKHYRFPNGVINGLMEYCMLQKEHRITRSFMLELADFLKETGVKTGREAFALLKKQGLRQAEYGEHPETADSDYNAEYVETNIALLARQLHDLRREIHLQLKRIDSRLDRMEKRLEELAEMLE